jgi:hypothetical protein
VLVIRLGVAGVTTAAAAAGPAALVEVPGDAGHR